MQEHYANAFLFERHQCLGLDLVPFTLRHAFLLNLAENPLAVGGIPTGPDLKQAALICSQPAPAYHFDMPRLSWWQRCKLEARTRTVTAADIFAFHAYLDDHCSAPELWKKEDDGSRASGCHWTLSTVTGLMRELGYTEEQAWQEAPGKAQWYLCSSAEMNPHADIRLVSEADQALMQKLKQEEVG